MIISENATDTIMALVTHNSNWDNCTFAIINLATIEPGQLEKMLLITDNACKHETFSHVCFNHAAVSFFTDTTFPALNKDLPEILSEDNSWVYVIMDKHDINGFSRPENVMAGGELLIFNREFNIRAYGKHSGELFETATIPLNVLEDYYLRKMLPGLPHYFSHEEKASQQHLIQLVDHENSDMGLYCCPMSVTVPKFKQALLDAGLDQENFDEHNTIGAERVFVTEVRLPQAKKEENDGTTEA